MSHLDKRYLVLEEEPAARLPVCLLIDKSWSMNVVTGGIPTGEKVIRDNKEYVIVDGGTDRRMDALLSAVGVFCSDIRRDTRAKASVELAIVSFGDNVVVERDFMPIDESLENFAIEANGNNTPLGLAVDRGLQLLDRRKEDYNEYGIAYYQPQLVILTDGEATDSDKCTQVAKDVQSRMSNGKLLSLPFLVGSSDETQQLRKFGPKNEVFQVAEASLASLFKYLSQSAIQGSRSNAGGTESHTIQQMLDGLRNAVKRI